MRTGPATPLGLDPGPCPECRGVSREAAAAAAGSEKHLSLATPLSPPLGRVSLVVVVVVVVLVLVVAKVCEREGWRKGVQSPR